jgi:hypothetical protein
VRKQVRNTYANINVAREGQFTVPTSVLVNLTEFDPANSKGTVTGQQTVTVNDIPASLRGVVQNQFTNIASEKDNYDTVELAFNKRFSGGLFIDSSFDYLWRDELRANSAVTNPFRTDPLNIGYFQNVYPAVGNRQTNTNWQAHLSGRYQFPYEIGVGANVQVQSGWPYTRLVSVSLPNAGTQTFFLDDISNHRSDTVPLVGVRADKSFPFGTHRVTLMLDVFNLLNSNAVTNFALTNGASFNKILATLQPRTAQLGFRLEF